MNLEILFLAFALVLTTIRCGLAEDSDYEELLMTLLSDDNQLMPNQTLDVLRALRTSNRFPSHLYELSIHLPLNCSKKLDVYWSSLEEKWRRSGNIIRYWEHYQHLHTDDCKWWSMTGEEKLDQLPLTQYTYADLTEANRLDLGLRKTFLVLRGIAEDPPRSSIGARLKTAIRDLIEMTTCTQVQCCDTGESDPPYDISSFSSNLRRYFRTMIVRSLGICYRSFNDILVNILDKKDGVSKPRAENNDYRLELEQLIKTIKKLITKSDFTVPSVSRDRYYKHTTELLQFYRLFRIPCKKLMKEDGFSENITTDLLNEQMTRVQSLMNNGLCLKLRRILAKISAELDKKEPGVRNEFLELSEVYEYELKTKTKLARHEIQHRGKLRKMIQWADAWRA